MASYKLTRPCAHCPFRADIRPYLKVARVQGIARGLECGEFFCHETIDTERFTDSKASNGSFYNPSGQEAHCAGALILLEKLGRPSQMMRIAERLHDRDGSPFYDWRRLDLTAPVFDSFEQMEAAHRREWLKGHSGAG